MTNGCPFCDELRGGGDNDFARGYGRELESRVWLESETFVALPSLGQLAHGHSLLLPRDHVLSMGQISGEQVGEFERVKRRMAEILENEFGSPLWFEHGCATEGNGGCGIYHAHLHAVPVGREVPGVREQLRHAFSEHPFHGWAQVRARVASSQPYLYYETPGGERYLYEVGELPSQYMRRLVAQELGKGEWNWRLAGYEPELVRSSVRLLEAAVATV